MRIIDEVTTKSLNPKVSCFNYINFISIMALSYVLKKSTKYKM